MITELRCIFQSRKSTEFGRPKAAFSFGIRSHMHETSLDLNGAAQGVERVHNI